MTEYEPCFNEEHMILNDRTRAIFNKEPEEVKIKRIFSDSAKFEVDSLRQKIDFIFIDGSHSYKYVQNDSEKAFEMLRKGGTIVWHDFTDGHQWPDVNRHLKELAKKKKLMRVSDTKFAVYRDGI
jgi:predicted O-methyltransferase YrrM